MMFYCLIVILIIIIIVAGVHVGMMLVIISALRPMSASAVECRVPGAMIVLVIGVVSC